MLDAGDEEFRGFVRHTLREAVDTESRARVEAPVGLVAFGVLDARLRREVRRGGLEQVILPAAQALFERPSATPEAGSPPVEAVATVSRAVRCSPR
jgi:hypothetical protein